MCHYQPLRPLGFFIALISKSCHMLTMPFSVFSNYLKITCFATNMVTASRLDLLVYNISLNYFLDLKCGN